MGLRQRLLFNIDSRLSIELNTQPRVWEESGEPADHPGLGLGKIIADARDTDKNPQCRATQLGLVHGCMGQGCMAPHACVLRRGVKDFEMTLEMR